MKTLATTEPTPTDVAMPLSPRPLGRPSGYSEETVGRLCEVIRRRGFADVPAAQCLGISRATLWRWKQDHPELEEWLEMAREQYRDAKLAIVDEAKTADGRPDWRAAAWALAKAFPEDYGRGAGTVRRDAAPERRSTAPSLTTLLEEREKEAREWIDSQMTPEIRDFVRRENEETEALLAQEAGEAP